MIKIKVTTPNPLIPFIRQTPRSKGIWDNCKFIIDKPIEKCDFWFVMDGLPKADQTIVPKENIVLITSESEDMKKYDQKYLEQFGMIVTSQRQIKHPRIIYTSAHGWMIGHMGGRSGVDPKDYHKYFTPYDKLKSIKEFKKDKTLSVFSSGKSRTPGQKLRLDFIEKLKQHFGEKLDVYGVNEKYVADKWDGIAPYKYHIALENSHRLDYFTEKLSDTFLAGAYPFYWGAPNINDYFPNKSLTKLDLKDFNKSISIIEKSINDRLYEKNQTDLIEARNMVLDKYNSFAIMADIANKHSSESEAILVKLSPENKHRPLPQKISETFSSVPGIYHLARWIYRKTRKSYEK